MRLIVRGSMALVALAAAALSFQSVRLALQSTTASAPVDSTVPNSGKAIDEAHHDDVP